MRRAAEVAPKCLLGSLVVEKKTEHGLESGAYVAKRRKRRVKDRSDRGEGCLHLITGLCPSYGQVYSTTARPVLRSVQCYVLAML